MKNNKSKGLTKEEVAKLDSYGVLSWRNINPRRANELWERELLWGRIRQKSIGGLL